MSTPSYVGPGFCVDCAGLIGETERVTARVCKGCGGPLHADCAMLEESTADDYCEPCLIRFEVNERATRIARMWELDKVAEG